MVIAKAYDEYDRKQMPFMRFIDIYILKRFLSKIVLGINKLKRFLSKMVYGYK